MFSSKNHAINMLSLHSHLSRNILLFVCSYMIDNGICYLTLTEKSYPKRLAFLFLEEISRDFEGDLRAEHGENWLRVVETVGRQYAFIKFGKILAHRFNLLVTVSPLLIFSLHISRPCHPKETSRLRRSKLLHQPQETQR
ncbi:hypothetical protein EON65_40985 [archaeon]|nr:MAG: hypothetical protein EON65_40985 [archaeon]